MRLHRVRTMLLQMCASVKHKALVTSPLLFLIQWPALITGSTSLFSSPRFPSAPSHSLRLFFSLLAPVIPIFWCSFSLLSVSQSTFLSPVFGFVHPGGTQERNIKAFHNLSDILSAISIPPHHHTHLAPSSAQISTATEWVFCLKGWVRCLYTQRYPHKNHNLYEGKLIPCYYICFIPLYITYWWATYCTVPG